MDELSNYVKKQLSSILTHVKNTPPKTSTSMAKIKKIVDSAPFHHSQKQSIKKSIVSIESLMSGKAKSKWKSSLKIQSPSRNPYVKQLFYEKILLTEKALQKKEHTIENWTSPKKSQKDTNSNDFNHLIDRLEEMKTLRMKRENYLCELMLKAQRLNRLIELKRQNEQKYLTSKMLSQGYKQKQKELKYIEKRALTAANGNQRKIAHSLISKYNHKNI